jgi:hypothetical protein
MHKSNLESRLPTNFSASTRALRIVILTRRSLWRLISEYETALIVPPYSAKGRGQEFN